MPYRRRRLNRRRKRQPRYRRKGHNAYSVNATRAFSNYPYVSIPRGRPTFPNKMNTIFRWSEIGNGLVAIASLPTTPSSATLGIVVNSLYDPGQSVFSKQPRFRDTLLGANGGTAPYHRYFVSAFKINVECYNSTTTNFVNNVAITLCSQDSTSPSSLDECYSRYDTRVVPITNASSSAVSKISHYGTTKNILSVASPIAQDQFKALYNADPLKKIYCYISFWNSDNTSANQMYYTVTLRQYATLYSRNDVADS